MSTHAPSSLRTLLQSGPYSSYAYSYPHKTAYRRLEPPVALRDAWANERRDALFLYLHVPFCEMRCGFCNLFTTVGADLERERDYLRAFQTQAERAREALGEASWARMAIGGGTPTYLSENSLNVLFDIADSMGANSHEIPVSIETSPQSATTEKLHILRERGVSRVSLGVQSFVESEVQASGRAQKTSVVEAAIGRIREADFPVFNIDLMYGLPAQTTQTWLGSLRRALSFAPQELYLYPLYVRPLTGIGKRGTSLQLNDIRPQCYREGRDLLLASGYRQVSMRMFQRLDVANDGPIYCCQEDGMVGIGCGARSYTSALHYSTEYAVGAQGVREIIADYIARPAHSFNHTNYGFALDEEEQRRRYLIQSLLQVDGLDLQAYRARFESDAFDDVPQLAELLECDLAEASDGFLRLNARGIEYSDAVGPWLGSTRVRQQMAAFALR